MSYFSAACPRNNIGNIFITNYCECALNIPEWIEEELLLFVLLRFKCIYEFGFKLWTQSNDNLIDKLIVGWRLVMSEKKGISTVEELKFVKVP